MISIQNVPNGFIVRDAAGGGFEPPVLGVFTSAADMAAFVRKWGEDLVKPAPAEPVAAAAPETFKPGDPVWAAAQAATFVGYGIGTEKILVKINGSNQFFDVERIVRRNPGA